MHSIAKQKTEKINTTFIFAIVVLMVAGLILLGTILYSILYKMGEKSADIKSSISVSEYCEENGICYEFIQAVSEYDEETDEYIIKQSVDEFSKLFTEYEDPAYVLLIHEVGEEKASEVTDNFTLPYLDYYISNILDRSEELERAAGK